MRQNKVRIKIVNVPKINNYREMKKHMKSTYKNNCSMLFCSKRMSSSINANFRAFTVLIATTFIVVLVVTGTVTTSVIRVVIVVAALQSKYRSQTYDDSHNNQDVVDHGSNVAADSNGMEGFSGVPLLSRS